MTDGRSKKPEVEALFKALLDLDGANLRGRAREVLDAFRLLDTQGQAEVAGLLVGRLIGMLGGLRVDIKEASKRNVPRRGLWPPGRKGSDDGPGS